MGQLITWLGKYVRHAKKANCGVKYLSSMKSTSVTLWVIAVALFCSSYNHLLNSCLCESIAPLALLHGVQRAIHQRLGMAVIYKILKATLPMPSIFGLAYHSLFTPLTLLLKQWTSLMTLFLYSQSCYSVSGYIWSSWYIIFTDLSFLYILYTVSLCRGNYNLWLITYDLYQAFLSRTGRAWEQG